MRCGIQSQYFAIRASYHFFTYNNVAYYLFLIVVLGETFVATGLCGVKEISLEISYSLRGTAF